MGNEREVDLLASITLIVATPSSQIRQHAEMGRFLQAFFYDTVALGNPVLSDHLHRANGLKPFTVSPPLPWDRSGGLLSQADASPVSAIRVGVLTAELYLALVDGLLKRCQISPILPLGSHRLEIEQVLLTGGLPPVATITSYEELYTGPVAHMFTMRFLTPTSFHTGLGNLPLPVPASIFRSLWQKWQRYAPPHVHFDEAILHTVERHVFPAHYALRTGVVRQEGSVRQVGFVGTCRFAVIGAISGQDQRAITTLSCFATYAGVGMKTTMGMGQTLV